MKKKLWLALLTAITVFALVIGITACSKKQPQTQQLGTPVVSISEDGIASWAADENAIAYAYKLDAGAEQQTLKTSIQLEDGQSISVKALAKEGYSDSAWSEAKTYTVPSVVHTYGEPEWNWVGNDEEGYTSATATFSCTDGDDTQNKTATVTSDIEKQATCTEAGNKVYTATVTFEGKTYTDKKNVAIESLGGHSLEWKYNEEGHVQECKNCDYKGEVQAHTWGEWEPDTTNSTKHTRTTECTEHEQQYTESKAHNFANGLECEDCGAENTHNLEIRSSQEGHWWVCTDDDCEYTSEIVPHTWGEWEEGETQHTHTSNCTEHTEQYTESEEHNYENGVCSDCDHEHNHSELVTNSNDTHHWSECEVCGYKSGEVEHTWGEWEEGETQHTHTTTCTEHEHLTESEDHSYDNGVCSVCDHTHNHGELVANSNQSGHWQECSDENCGYRTETQPHTWGAWTPDTTNSAKHTHTNTCEGHAGQYSESANHHFEGNACSDCQAQDPDYSAATWVEFDFSDVITKVSTSAYGVAGAEEEFIKALSDETVKFNVTATNNIYAGDGANLGLIKFSSGSANGSITLEFKKNVKRVVINASKYGSDASTLKVNGGTAQSTQSTAADYKFDITPSKTVKIDAVKRSYVYSITVYFEDYQAKLETPNLSIDLDGVVTWGEVEHATKYAYQIGEGSVTYVELSAERSVQLADGETVKVWAVGDSEYADSSAAEITYTMIPVTLGTPDVEISLAGVASWDAIENAVKYVYVITGAGSDGTEKETTGLSVQLTDGQTIKVKAVGRENSRFQESAYCEPLTYTAPIVAEQLANPTVTVAIDGTVTIENRSAVSFDYTIGGVTNNIANGEGGAAVTLGTKLTNGQTIKVVAKGDGTYSTDSEEVQVTYKAPLTFDAPTDFEFEADTVISGNILIKWTAVDNATSYTVTVDGKETVVTKAEHSVEFKAVTSLTVKTNANGVTEGNGADYSGVYYESAAADITEKFNKYYNDNKPVPPEETFVFSELGYNNQTAVTTVKGELVTLEFSKDTGSTAPTYYTSGAALRLYAKNKFTISASKNIVEIVISYGDTKSASVTANKGTYNDTTTAKSEATWSGAETEIIFTVGTSGQAHIKSIKIIYEENLDDQGKVNKVKDSLKTPQPTDTDEDSYWYELPLSDDLGYGTTITWAVTGLEEDDEYDETDGTLVVMRRDEDAEITVKATVTLNGATAETQTFTLTIPALGGEVTPPPSKDPVTVTAKSPATSSNMKEGTNHAADLGLDASIFSVTTTGGSTKTGMYAEIRMYQNNVLTVSVTGATILSIVITTNQGAISKLTAGGVTVEGTLNGKVYSYDINANTFSITNTSSTQLRITQIEIKYQPA